MRHYVIITERRNGTLTKLKTARLGKSETIQYKGKTYPLDLTRPHHIHRTKTYYLLDIHEGQLTAGGVSEGMPTDLLDLILTRQIARQLVTSMSTSMLSGQLLPIIIGVAIGLPCGIIAGGYI